ncbi:MAG: rod shape-determining protein MreD [Novosphingobium sp.]|uniref:rod shape-determining protein MreD n=1 Tax=Tsuneonella sp. CC-YZS046 TaxID=3042152 RepID=UPI002D7849E0|nr:rod shape-determining protein MreD [Tsuneonella sp. CC-YZS046]WRO67666.1 rod shape-determining protein MreD [Tsuneonella sp. CC-YZS046]
MIDEYNPRARRDPFGSKINRDHSPVIASSLPWVTIMLGSLCPMLPIIPPAPLFPPAGFMMLLGWRLVRPGLLPPWAGCLLGAFDDLFSGQPFGCAILLWSLSLLAIEALETRFPWRGFMQDWLVAALLIAAYLVSGAILAGNGSAAERIVALPPQLLLSVLLFPIFGRMVSTLDRFRLRRFRTVR